jgi:hypothetical protein
LKHLITGLTVPQQYVCLPLESLSEPLSIFLTSDESKLLLLDITSSHVFLGYKPLLIMIACESQLEKVCLSFVSGDYGSTKTWRGFPTSTKAVSRVVMKRIMTFTEDKRYQLFEGEFGWHRMINPLYQLVARVRNAFRESNASNVALPGNLYDQVRIAYSIPRIIGVITLGDEESMNMFPTDLHGKVDDRHYFSSLRLGGKANQQVKKFRKIVLSFMNALEYRHVYALGKNHMQETRSKENFDLSPAVSQTFHLPLPRGAVSYIELRLLNSCEMGIHCIHVYEIVNEEKISEGRTLSHIHQFYAQWRIDHHQSTPMLLR